jgi:hypothetical protein
MTPHKVLDTQELSLRTVDDLRLTPTGDPQRYFIANYQRGYRWSPLQVTQLLDDILEFTERPNQQPDEFYCLQPLVLTIADNGDYEVVDGQQRLTTILLILRHFNERLTEKYRLPLYLIEYETRPDLLDFLDAPTEEKADDNADFFHLFQAANAVEDWFIGKENKVDDIKSALLNRTKVIWFQLAESDNAVEAFTRLNVGKIPLTNDELIRALFLRRESAEQAEAEDLQRQIANEWDQYEKALQSNDFWFFISNDQNVKQNRISLLFDLVADANGLTEAEERDEYGVFCAFNRRLNEYGVTTKSEWREIKKVFMTLEEWYDDRVLYHLVGFLIHEGHDVQKIRGLTKNCTKSAFEAAVQAEIFGRVIGEAFPIGAAENDIRELVANRVEELSYEKQRDHRKIRSLLLLFNIASLLEDSRSTVRFQFDSFKTEAWDIEHVRSVAPDRLQNRKDQSEWLIHSLEVLKFTDGEKKLCKKIGAFLELPTAEVTDEAFAKLYREIVKFFGEDTEENDDSVANLVLLDRATNRSYKNSVFAVKRQRLLSLDRAGIFVPLCTRNVFLKCYSDHVEHLMFWSQADRESYQAAIAKTLVEFFVQGKGA